MTPEEVIHQKITEKRNEIERRISDKEIKEFRNHVCTWLRDPIFDLPAGLSDKTIESIGLDNINEIELLYHAFNELRDLREDQEELSAIKTSIEVIGKSLNIGKWGS